MNQVTNNAYYWSKDKSSIQKNTVTAAAVIQPGTGLGTFVHLVCLSNCPVELSKCLQDIL